MFTSPRAAPRNAAVIVVGVSRSRAVTKAVTAVMVAAALLLAACGTPADEQSRPSQVAPSEESQRLDAALRQADLALTEFDDAHKGDVYKGIRGAGRGVDIDTTLAATATSVGRAVELCNAAAPHLAGYRVAVHARNGRLLAFRVHDRCRRMHMKATTTLWSVSVLHSR